MKTQLRLLLLASAFALAAVPLAGCGGTECGQGTTEKDGKCVAVDDEGPKDPGDEDPPGEDITCGPGTQLEDDQCVPTGTTPEPGECPAGSEFDEETERCVLTEDACGPNTRLDEDGRCVISADACEEDEALDPNSGQCISGTECGPGTALEADTGNCVPTDEVCNEGTEFDEETGLCLPDASCREGDVVLDGICVSPAEDLAARADVTETENNDPAMGGEPDELELKGAGAQTIFTGVIGEPEDLNGDDQLDQDIDVFSFEAEEGDWFQLAVQSLGLPSPAFIIEGPDDYSRQSSLASAQDPARQFVATASGTYTISVLPTSALLMDGPFGGDDWGYVGVLEQIEVPNVDGFDFSDDPLESNYGVLSDSFYQVDGFDTGDLITLTVEESGASADGLLQFWSGTEGFLKEDEISSGDSYNLIVPADGELQLLMDWARIDGPNTGFKLTAALTENVEALGLLDDGSHTTDPVDVASGEVQRYTFNIDAGKIIELSFDHTSTSTGKFTIRDATGEVQYTVSSVSAGSEYNYWYSAEGGTFVLEVEPTLSSSNFSDAETTLNVFPPTDLGTPTAGDSINELIDDDLERTRSHFYLLDMSDPLIISGDFTSENDEDIDVYFMNESLERLKSFITSGSEVIPEMIMDAGVYLIQVRAYAATPSYEVNLEFEEAPQMEVEPNDTKDEATPVDISERFAGTSADTDDVDFFSFELDDDMEEGEVLLLKLAGSNPSTEEYTCLLMDDNEEPIGANASNSTEKGCISMASGLVAGETYYFKIERSYGTDNREYIVTPSITGGVVEAEPNDSTDDATVFDLDELGQDNALYGHLPDDDDVDYFRFELSDDLDADTYLYWELERIGSNPVGSGTWSILDEDGVELDSASTNDGSTLSSASMSAGVYYLKLTRSNSTRYYSMTYKISVRPVVTECGNGIVEPGEECDGGYNCSATCEIISPTVSETNSDAQSISPGNSPVPLSITADSCDHINGVSVDLNLSNAFNDNTLLTLEGPSGTTVVLHDRDLHSYNSNFSFVGNFPENISVDDPDGLDKFIGENGTGEWVLYADYDWSGTSASFNSYTLNLYCD